MERCGRCGYSLGERARWCPLCLAVRVDHAELADDLRATVSAVWVPADRHFAPTPPRRFARALAGPLSFGFLPKLGMTIALATVALLVLMMASWHPVYLGVTGVVVSLAGGLLLRAIWRKERVG